MNYKMTPEEYFRKMIELYFSAREPKFYNPNIFRGRSSSISSELEDLTALFVALNNPNQCNYFTDQPIKFEGSTTKYPDIVIQNLDGTIHHLIDTKADTGWNRDGMLKFCEDWNKRISSVQGTKTAFVNGKTKTQNVGTFSKDLHYHVLVASQVNSGNQILADYETINKKCKNVSLYILSSGIHPNHYGLAPEEILARMKINTDEFERLMKHIMKCKQSQENEVAGISI